MGKHFLRPRQIRLDHLDRQLRDLLHPDSAGPLRLKFTTFLLPKPNSQKILSPLTVNPKQQGRCHNATLFPHFGVKRSEKNQRLNWLQGTGLLFDYLRQNFVGYC
uniref:Uncharacterized protein n=1 Tax=Candidatus Kentrum sp. LPFa TaxID=2126335 RepID=A0A450X5C2_9GAMM|nr:MAG: hypothetical protein BECKLPF1236A_GA0070988_104211 [Candidatus Kentron sp. LPFa]